jgi:hypothetical protein
VTRKHLGPSEIENKRRISTGADPKTLKQLADAQGRLAKVLAKNAVQDEETDNEKKH